MRFCLLPLPPPPWSLPDNSTKMPERGDQGKKLNTAGCANESASWAGRSSRLRDRGGCSAPCQRARPLRRAGLASAHRTGLRKCCCQESEASQGEQQKVTPESASGGGGQSPTCSLSAPGRTVSPPVHLPCPAGPSAWSCTPHRSRFPRCLLLFVSVNFTYTRCAKAFI